MPAPSAEDLKKYRDAANDKFTSLVREAPPDYWKTAHAFDTMLDFLNYCSADKDKESDASSAAKWLIAHKASSPDGIWFDDFGWWTIATTRARTLSSINQDLRDQLDVIADWCWDHFTDNAPHVYERRPQAPKHPDDPYKDCEPYLPNGVWNSYWSNTDPKWEGPKEGDPNAGFQGIQNTVTNAVYLLSAQLRGDPRADLEWDFLSSWIAPLTLYPPDPSLWWQIDPSSGLVRERVSRYKTKPAPTETNPGFQMDWAWTGDQGLILQALILRARTHPTGPPDGKIILAEMILNGVLRRLVDNEGVLMRWTHTGNSPSGYESDYRTGIGVFWRSALRVWEQNDVRVSLKQYRTVLQKAAEAASATKPQEDWVALVNDLAVLVAAYVMLPEM